MTPSNSPMPLRVGVNPFATNTFAVRLPKILRDVLRANPDYPASIQRQVEQLAVDMETGAPIPHLNPLFASDYDTWEREIQRQAEMTPNLSWRDSEWFFAETYLYRWLIEAVRWYETERDPFAPLKQEELGNARLWQLLEKTQQIEGSFAERLSALLAYDLWGNRADLSHVAQSIGTHDIDDSDWLADDRAQVITYLSSLSLDTCAIHIICDNAGTELALDLALVDGLFTGGVGQVVLHLKAHPTFVSDAIVADVWQLVDVMEAHGSHAHQLAIRLRSAWTEGRLRLAPHFYWNSPNFLWAMPEAMQQTFQRAALVILKGDANYRRAVGDALWEPITPFREVLVYFPAPLLALRTMKSDPIVGLQKGDAEHLDSIDAEWRLNGRRGVIQLKV